MRGSFRLLLGDVRDQLRELDRHSVHCVVTSPPYHGLRDYGVEGQIGREATWQEHLAVLGDVFREVHRVLRPDGVLWLNYGDAYAQQGRAATPEEHAANAARAEAKGYHTGAFSDQTGWDRAAGTATGGLKPKDLMGMPWRLALALQDAGWWLRADCIWSKSNPTPEPPRGRPTVSHEYVFLLAKSERYFYDGEAVRVPHKRLWDETNGGSMRTTPELQAEAHAGRAHAGRAHAGPYPLPNPGGRNLWTVWHFPTQAFPGSGEHFATFPEELARICIAAGTSEKGCCPACGAPWRRVLEARHVGDLSRHGSRAETRLTKGNGFSPPPDHVPPATIGWEPTCQCPAHEPVPCTVLDPFAGSGTTGVVALRLGRSFVGVELNPAYHALATRRLDTALLPVPKRSKPRADDTLPLFANCVEEDSRC